MSGPIPLHDLLSGSAHLKRLRAAADERRALTQRVRTLLAENEAQHLMTARLTPLGELILVLDSPAWAARVRYYQERIRHGLKPLEVTRVRVQAQPRG
jgi:hypothetical protein